MAVPPSGTLTAFSGIPVFVSTDSAGTSVVPMAPYTNANGLWIPRPTDAGGNPLSKAAPSTALFDGSVSLTTGTVQLPSQTGSEFLIQADPANSNNVLLGATSGTQPIVLGPGASVPMPIVNLNLLYASTNTGTATLNWIGRS